MSPLALALTLILPAHAGLTFAPSPALEQLAAENDRLGAASMRSEASKNSSSVGFDGEPKRGFTIKTLKPVGTVDPKSGESEPVKDDADEPADEQPKPKGSNSYIFVGKTPIKGVTIYTPKEDPNGTGRTEKPKPQGPIKNWMVYGALGLGLLATIAGIFFPPLLFLGGLGLGAGAVLYAINKKFAK